MKCDQLQTLPLTIYSSQINIRIHSVAIRAELTLNSASVVDSAMVIYSFDFQVRIMLRNLATCPVRDCTISRLNSDSILGFLCT